MCSGLLSAREHEVVEFCTIQAARQHAHNERVLDITEVSTHGSPLTPSCFSGIPCPLTTHVLWLAKECRPMLSETLVNASYVYVVSTCRCARSCQHAHNFSAIVAARLRSPGRDGLSPTLIHGNHEGQTHSSREGCVSACCTVCILTLF